MRSPRDPHHERGQALTEIALALPILCILMFAIIEYGTMIWQDMELTSAARDGARRAVVARVEPTPAASVEQAALDSLDTVDADDVHVTVQGGWTRGDEVTVTVTKHHDLDVFGFVVWSGDLRAVSTVVIG